MTTPTEAWAAEIEPGELTAVECLRLICAVLAGKASGAGTDTIVFRNAVADSKDRVIATVDGTGDRLEVITDVTE